MGGVEKRLQLLKRGSNWRLTHPPDDKAATCAALISRLEVKIIRKITILSDKFANELEIALLFWGTREFNLIPQVLFSVRVIFWLFVYKLFLTIDLVPQTVEDYFVAKIFYSKLSFNLAFRWPCGMIPDIAYIWSQCAHNTYVVYYTEWFWLKQQIVGPLLY